MNAIPAEDGGRGCTGAERAVVMMRGDGPGCAVKICGGSLAAHAFGNPSPVGKFQRPFQVVVDGT
jgi:hypothetical protein